MKTITTTYQQFSTPSKQDINTVLENTLEQINIKWTISLFILSETEQKFDILLLNDNKETHSIMLDLLDEKRSNGYKVLGLTSKSSRQEVELTPNVRESLVNSIIKGYKINFTSFEI